MKFFLGLMMSCVFLFASVELNNASENELAKLKGIGAAKAKDIVAYRDANGCFQSIDELSKVKGIGAKTIEKNRDSLSLGECKK
jgi:competence protein ComEA